MAMSFPLDREAFIGTLRIRSFSLELAERLEVSGLGDGSILRDQLGPRLWRGRIELHAAPFGVARAMTARIMLLQEPGRSFLVWPVDQAGPALDPEGSALGQAAPVIASLAPSGRELSLSGLPAGLQARLRRSSGLFLRQRPRPACLPPPGQRRCERERQRGNPGL